MTVIATQRVRETSTLTARGSGRTPVLAGQVLGSLGLGAAGASGALLITDLTGSGRLAAAPLGAVVLGGVFSAWPVARQRNRVRRAGALAFAFVLAGLGAALVLSGAGVRSVPLVLLGHVLLGAGNTAVMLSRYLVADLGGHGGQARAIGTSFLAVFLGAVTGPALLGPAAALASPLDMPAPAGLYVVSLAALLLAAGVLAVTSWLTTSSAAGAGAAVVRGTRTAPARDVAGATGAVLSMGTANLTMVSLMAVVPLHLDRHGHDLEQIGWAVSGHVAAMFLACWAFGPVTERLGARTVTDAGNLTLVATAAAAVVAPVGSMPTGTAVLIALGVGWGAVVVANSTHLSTAVAQQSRGTLEAGAEIAMGLGAALGCFALAGPLVEAGGVPLLAAVLIPLHLGQLVHSTLRPRPTRSVPRGRRH
jgi:hypothetical protein